ncbi:hypothetical protein, partial [Faecalibaculum rodentium]|uniref:hypothetical protein n=1 Tax=Faecalibaculum rodentium TaxID=1702221 RepID=UPI003F66F530
KPPERRPFNRGFHFMRVSHFCVRAFLCLLIIQRDVVDERQEVTSGRLLIAGTRVTGYKKSAAVAALPARW